MEILSVYFYQYILQLKIAITKEIFYSQMKYLYFKTFILMYLQPGIENS